MTASQIFKKAHKIAKTLIGNYSACMSYALKEVYREIKETRELLRKNPFGSNKYGKIIEKEIAKDVFEISYENESLYLSDLAIRPEIFVGS